MKRPILTISRLRSSTWHNRHIASRGRDVHLELQGGTVELQERVASGKNNPNHNQWNSTYYDDEEDVNKQEEEVEQECNDPREEQ